MGYHIRTYSTLWRGTTKSPNLINNVGINDLKAVMCVSRQKPRLEVASMQKTCCLGLDVLMPRLSLALPRLVIIVSASSLLPRSCLTHL